MKHKIYNAFLMITLAGLVLLTIISLKAPELKHPHHTDMRRSISEQ